MQRLINFLLIICFLIGYLEWGKDNHSFLFQAEYEIFFPKKFELQTYAHPAVFIPFIGQILLLITLFQKQPRRWMTISGMALQGVLMLLIFLIGTLGKNFYIAVSALPYLLCSMWCIAHLAKTKKQAAIN